MVLIINLIINYYYYYYYYYYYLIFMCASHSHSLYKWLYLLT